MYVGALKPDTGPTRTTAIPTETGPTGDQGEKEALQRCKWTSGMKKEFHEAIEILGGAERATPKSIMEIMKNKPANLTISHVKSRLQRCRNGREASSGLASIHRRAEERPGQEEDSAVSGEEEGRPHRRALPLLGADAEFRAELLQRALAHHRQLLHQVEAQTQICQEMQAELSNHLGYVHSLVDSGTTLPSISEGFNEPYHSLQGPTFSSDTSNFSAEGLAGANQLTSAGFETKYGGDIEGDGVREAHVLTDSTPLPPEALAADFEEMLHHMM